MKNIRITLLILIFGAGIIKPLFEDYKAFEAYKGEAYDTSIKYLQVKQIENPHDPELNYNLGVAHFRGAHYANAIKDFERVVANADEKNPLRVKALYNAGNSFVKETERVLGPDWETKKVEEKKIDSCIQDLERAVVRYSQVQMIKEMSDAQQNQAYAEKLIEKLKQKKQQQQQQNKDDKDKDDKDDKHKDKDKKNDKDKNKDGKDDGKNSSDGDDKKGNDSPDKKNKKDKGKDKKDKGSKDKDKDKDSGKDDKNDDEDKDKDGDDKEDKGDKDKEKPEDKKDQGQDPQEDQPDKKPGDYKKEKQPESEGDEKKEGDKPEEPQKGGAAPQEQEQGSDDQSSGSAGGSEPGQQQDALYDVLKADDSMEKKAMRALLDDLDEKEAAKQKALMQYQSKSAATSGELGQKPW